ncbi:LptA/OstA family protein [Devosia sp. YIM 151766]|uniref:LptA/OstA family protein n=1 Tax=Devosia sp. YIM 151766 TaxID=3017325 RepID=UPI00255D0225|nr:LptA/OstA family protein [Devosia sp. YIM 151766]WIY52883.1 LptA/OstA family protein [Devosia sp. YIM 151766]
MRLMRPVFALLAVLLLTPGAQAQRLVEITSDLFVMNEAAREAVFTGNVVVVHPSVTVWAPRVVATYGDGGTSDIRTFEALGGEVRLKTPDQDAIGDHAVFTPADQLLRLTGNVKVTNASGVVDASELVVNLETNISTFTSPDGGRVTGIFNSQ